MNVVGWLLLVGTVTGSDSDRLPIEIGDLPILNNGGVGFEMTGRLHIVDAPTVKIWMTTIKPGVPLKFHRHLTGRLIIPMQDMTLVKNYDAASRRKPERIHWKRGKAYQYEADKVGVYHNDENPSDTPYQVMVVAFRDRVGAPVVEMMH